jgi:hypothetical protein
MAARSTVVTFDNQTEHSLTKIHEHLDHGHWDTHPPPVINPRTQVVWKTESSGFMTGTEGSVRYQLDTNLGIVDIHWDNPYAGSNSYDQHAPDGFAMECTGGSGNDARVVFTLRTATLATLPSIPIRSLAVRIITSTEALAGTDNDVYFDVGPLSWSLDKPGYNDFERGADDTYELNLPALPLSTDDLIWLRLQKKGIGGFTGMPDGIDGAWKLAQVHLIVNDQELIRAAVDHWLDQDHPVWVFHLRPEFTAEERFAHSLRMIPNAPISGFDESVAVLTTNLFKLQGISGWIGTSLPITCAMGTVIREPAQSTDGLATIDLQLESLQVGDRQFVLDAGHGFAQPRFLRVEYAYGGFPPLFSGNPLPHNGQRVRICGEVKWDSDHEGWNEIHPRSVDDVQIFT